jgi:hypothetical protein
MPCQIIRRERSFKTQQGMIGARDRDKVDVQKPIA